MAAQRGGRAAVEEQRSEEHVQVRAEEDELPGAMKTTRARTTIVALRGCLLGDHYRTRRR